MFISYMYVDIVFPPTKSISVMFESVTTHCQTPKTWIDHNVKHHHDSTCYRTRYHAFPLSLA